LKKKLLFCLVFVALCFGIKSASAQSGYTLTWTGGSNNWNNMPSWSITPGPVSSYPGNDYDNDVVVINNSVTVTITGPNFPDAISSGGNSVYSLAIGPNVTVNLKITGIASLGVMNAITVGTNSTLNISGPGDITGTSAITLSSGAKLTTAVGCTINAASLTMNSTSAATFNDLVTLTGAINIDGSSTITGTSTAVTATSLAYSGSFTLTEGTAMIINGSLNTNNGSTNTLTFNNTSGNATPTIAITGGSTVGTFSATTLSFTATNPGTATINSTITINQTSSFLVGANVTMNLTSGSLGQGGGAITFNNAGNITTNTFPINFTDNGGTNTFVNSGTITANSNMSFEFGNFTNSGTVTAQNATILTLNANTFTFTNTGTINIIPTAAANSTFVISGSGVTFKNTSPGQILVTGITGNATTLFTVSPNSSTIANTGSISATNAPVLWSANAFTSINNSGTITLVTSPLTITKGTTFTNTGTISASSSSTLNFGTATSTVVTFNNTSPGVLLMSGSTFNYPGNSAVFTNTGIVTATASSSFLLGTTGSTGTQLNNSGIFNAGISNSPCTISTATTTSQISISNTGTFNLGSTSIIILTDNQTSNPSTVSNSGAGVFTLESDQFGSASIGASGTPTGTGTSNINQFTGSYNVQRYLSGANTKYRSYHLLSSPVNITSTVGSGNIGISYINTNATIVNANAVAGTTTNFGALTGGTSGTTNGFTVANNNPTLYLYRESNPVNDASFISGKYVGINKVTGTTVNYISTVAPTSGTVSIPAGNGYLIYFIGNDNSLVTASTRVPEATTITATGMLNQQSVAVTIGSWSTGTTSLGYTAAFAGVANSVGNGLGSAGFNLVGNPYASVIDLKKVYSDNVSGTSYTTFYELNDVNPSQGYVSYNGKDSTKSSPTLSSRWIASGQGFIVQATASPANQTITFKEDQKVYSTSGIINSASSPPIFLTAPQRPAPGLNSLNAVSLPSNTRSIVETSAGISGLHLMLKQDSNIYRECGIYFNKNWSDNYDYNDAYDIDGVGLQVFMSSFTADGVRTGINELGDYTKGKRVKLYVKAVADGNYNLELEDIANIDTSLFNIYLVDHKNQDSLDIVRYKTYVFTITNADTTSFGANRLTLDIERKPLPQYQLVSFTAQKANDGVLLTWKTNNEGDYTGFGIQKLDGSTQYVPLYNVQSDGDGTYTYIDHYPATGNNTYRLQQINIDSLVSYSSPLNVVYSVSTPSSNLLSVYPNPARGLIKINFNSTTTTPASSYLSYIYNSVGELVMQQTANSNTWTQDVSALKPGAYVIQIKTINGNSIGNSKFVRVQ
jgi:hypothetical protein